MIKVNYIEKLQIKDLFQILNSHAIHLEYMECTNIFFYINF